VVLPKNCAPWALRSFLALAGVGGDNRHEAIALALCFDLGKFSTARHVECCVVSIASWITSTTAAPLCMMAPMASPVAHKD